MKKVIAIYCLTVLIATSSVAQIRDVLLTGKANQAAAFITLLRQPKYGIVPLRDTIRLKTDKVFAFRLKLKEAEIVLISDDKTRLQLYLNPGDVLDLNLQNKKPVLKGNAAIFANYFIDDDAYLVNKYKEYAKRNPGFNSADNQGTDNYFTVRDSIYENRLNFLNSYFSGSSNKNKQAFIRLQTLRSLYSDLFSKHSGMDIEKFKFYQIKYNVRDKNAYAYTDKIEFNKMSLLSIDFYRRFAIEFVGSIAQKRIKDSGQKWNFNTYIDLTNTIIDELCGGSAIAIELKAICLNYVVNETVRDVRMDWTDKLFSTLASFSNTPNVSMALIKEKLDKLILDTRFRKGAPAPDFNFRDSNGKSYSLKDFKGKKIYLDLGASWCGPCIASIPAWNKLVASNADNQNVVFISLSLDNTEGDWRKFLKEHAVNGIRLYAGEGGLFTGNFAKSYNIASIPKFILIDEEGKIIQYAVPMHDNESIMKLLNKS